MIPRNIRCVIRRLDQASSFQCNAKWVRAHNGTAGNERADALAELAASKDQIDTEFGPSEAQVRRTSGKQGLVFGVDLQRQFKGVRWVCWPVLFRYQGTRGAETCGSGKICLDPPFSPFIALFQNSRSIALGLFRSA
ncbi:hypothetical protein AVEN_101215-1 [Araneus ventricosus]|uniref:RNase H type-1 domain-containing protein n=1 Tax=Araneus ventricosus TaxID=182803 RepID=A0A4Y2FXW3_ARAVE|nr:hypothetical protein AVEN_101215-1 [Araneus ventricosus]